MRKFNSKKIVSLFLALMMLVGIMSISAFAAETEEHTESVSFVSKNIAFGEKVHLMFAVPAAEIEGKEVVTTVKLGDKTSTVSQKANEKIRDVECAVFTADLGVAAQDIDAIYTVTIEVNGEVVADFTYSVLEYLYERKFVSDNVREDQYVMYDAFLAYAGALDTTLAVDNKTFGENFVAVNEKYVYVNTVDCTFDGGKTAGIVEKNTVAAFASTEEVVDGAILTYTVKNLDGTGSAIKSAEEMATYALENHCVVTAKVEEVIPDVVQLTASANIADYASLNGWANDTKHTTLNVNSNVNVTITGGDNSGKYYTNGNNWRAYQGEKPSITISATNGQILSVKITYVSEKTGVLTLDGANVVSGTVVDVNDTSVVFGVGNTSTDVTNGQVRITAVEVTYQVAVHTCDYTDATCTAYASCTICGATTGELAAHDWVDATCTAPKTCSVCKAAEGVALPHSYDGGVVTTPATCTTPGVKTFTCVDCGDTKTETIPPLNHNGLESGVCPDCGEDVGGAVVPTVGVLATFEFGANKTTATEGTADSSTYTESNNGYTLSITGGSKFYKNSYDGKGNSCIKLGSSSAAGKFTFTVPDNVTEVIIYVAGRYAKNGGIKVNGTSTDIKTYSNNGEYTEIVIDTSSTKTISVATYKPSSNGDNRLYVNTIVFNGYAK